MAWLSPPRTTPPVWVAVDGELGVHVRSVMTKVGLHAFDKVLNNGQAMRSDFFRVLVNRFEIAAATLGDCAQRFFQKGRQPASLVAGRSCRRWHVPPLPSS